MDIREYLRDMDREEEELRAQIMRLQIRIQQLNDARLLLMSREEERAQNLGYASPFGSLAGGQIVVRDPAKMMPKPQAEALPAPKAVPAVTDTYVPPAGIERLGVASVAGLLKAEGPLTKPEIIRRLAVVGPDEAVKLTKTLSNMRQHGYVTRDAEQRFIVKKLPRTLRDKRQRPIAKPDPERAARERQAVLDVLARATEPLPSGDVIAAVMGPGKPDKPRRDRLYWALKSLRDSGAVNFREGLYRLAPKAA